MPKLKRKFAIQSEEKRIISGAAMLADLPIYRRDEVRGEYYVVFDKQNIKIWLIIVRAFKKLYLYILMVRYLTDAFYFLDVQL